MNGLAARLHAALPQTQCTRCGYPDCESYARAMAGGEAGINHCPPGGSEGIARLAALTGQAALPLDPANGVEGPRAVAVIDEDWCIGCTLCMKACPTDAILGLNKRMHTVVEPYCTGCELCVPACPVDCISMQGVTPGRTGWDAWSAAQAAEALQRYELRKQRLQRDAVEHRQLLERKAEARPADQPTPAQGPKEAEADRKRSIIEAALARARARRQQ